MAEKIVINAFVILSFDDLMNLINYYRKYMCKISGYHMSVCIVFL